MSIRFDNKVVLVTGGAMGIGLATAKKFAELGAKVAILDRDAPAGQKAAQAVGSGGRAARFVECDVADEASVARGVKTIGEEFGGVDVLVSNAGIQRYGDVVGTSEELWNEVMDVNLKGCFHVAKAALPLMIARAGGAIVVVASVQTFTAGRRDPPAGTRRFCRLDVTHTPRKFSAPGGHLQAVDAGAGPTLILSVGACAGHPRRQKTSARRARDRRGQSSPR